MFSGEKKRASPVFLFPGRTFSRNLNRTRNSLFLRSKTLDSGIDRFREIENLNEDLESKHRSKVKSKILSTNRSYVRLLLTKTPKTLSPSIGKSKKVEKSSKDTPIRLQKCFKVNEISEESEISFFWK